MIAQACTEPWVVPLILRVDVAALLPSSSAAARPTPYGLVRWQSRDQENAARKRRVFCDFQTPTTARGGGLNGVICTRAERVSPFFNKTRPTPESNGQKRH